MEQAAELKALYRRICEAQSKGDHEFFEGLFSREEGVLAIGTDPEEWWSGYDAIVRVFEAQLKEVAGIEISADTPRAYCQGGMGWAAGQPTLKFTDGREMAFRLTVVFQKEQEEWKIVLWHSSIGIPNEDAIGETLTTR